LLFGAEIKAALEKSKRQDANRVMVNGGVTDRSQ
jgi:hypothetical protein